MYFLIFYIVGILLSGIIITKNFLKVEHYLTVMDLCVIFAVSLTSWLCLFIFLLLYLCGKIDFDKVVYEDKRHFSKTHERYVQEGR